MQAAKIVMALLCAAALLFLLRVLLALVKERNKVSSRAVEVYLAKFIPSKKRGELIVMNAENVKRKLPA